LLETLADGLRPTLSGDPIMVGIHTGGAWLAERLHAKLALPSRLGTLDITFYRDDFSTIGLHPQVKPSHLPEDVEGRNIILVDDVLQTGRTIRAALNEIFSFGRPRSVRLAVLVDRGLRELPIQADACALRISMPSTEHLKLLGPDVLELKIMHRDG
jgi:pyrimidine operon attenuation protein/uracil phosphoribosyltransferase